MKKIICLLLSILMVVSVVPMYASADADNPLAPKKFNFIVKNDGKKYGNSCSEKHYEITGRAWTNYDTELVIPDREESMNIIYPIYRIAANAFIADPSDTVDLGQIYEVGNSAFEYKNITVNGLRLRYLRMSKNIKIIGKKAFKKTAISSLDLPSNDLEIGSEAFAYCENLSYVHIGYGNHKIANDAFSGCSELRTIQYAGTEADWKALGIDLGVQMKYEKCALNKDHTYKFEKTITAATCQLKGLAQYKCSTCGYTKQVETDINPKNHKNITWIVTIPSTCENKGSEAGTCACGYDAGTREKAALGHSMYWTTTLEPTCTEPGSKNGYCRRSGCDYKPKDVAISALGHNLVWTTTLEPNCTETGLKNGDCSRCDYVETNVSIPELGHNLSSTFTNPTCTTDGFYTYNCRWCNFEEIKADESRKAYGHKFYSYSSECQNRGCDFVCTDHPGNDDNLDGKCDLCGNHYAKNCTHLCHKGGFWYAICLFFWKLFKMNKTCECGMRHYK